MSRFVTILLATAVIACVIFGLFFFSPFDISNSKLGVGGKEEEEEEVSVWAICLCIKDESKQDMEEWIRYHVAMGVSDIYLFDNDSSPKLLSLIDPKYLKMNANTKKLGKSSNGVVTYHYRSFDWTNKWWSKLGLARHINMQIDVYRECFDTYGSRHRFLAFIDVDEFIVVRNASRNIADILLLEQYKRVGGLVLHWQLFGSSGREQTHPASSGTSSSSRSIAATNNSITTITRPSASTMATRGIGGVLGTYTTCARTSHIKSIVQTKHTQGPSDNMHWFKYKAPFFAVNEKLVRVDSWQSDPPSFDTIWINHYTTKSRQDFAKKIARGTGSGATKKWWYFDYVNGLPKYDSCLEVHPLDRLTSSSS